MNVKNFERVLSMSENKISIVDNGPYRITGDVQLVDAEGNTFETKRTFSLCRCGKSANIPFCDGTHKKEFQSVVRAK